MGKLLWITAVIQFIYIRCASLQIVFLSRHLPVLLPENLFNLSFKLVLDFRHDFDVLPIFVCVYLRMCTNHKRYSSSDSTSPIDLFFIISGRNVVFKQQQQENTISRQVQHYDLVTFFSLNSIIFTRLLIILYRKLYLTVRCTLVTMAVANNTKNKMHETRCAKIKFICVLRYEFQWDSTLFISTTPFFS